MMKVSSSLILKLLELPGIGNKKAHQIAKKLADEHLVSLNDRELYDFVCDIQKKELFANTENYFIWLSTVEQVVEKSEKNNVFMVNYFDKNYPENLRKIDNPPLVLNFKGNLNSILEQPNIAIIGTREPTDYGFRAGKRLGLRFAENDINVVSGLAIGCDTAGHMGALAAHKTTTAILAHGLHTIYPKENKNLSNEILDNNGLLISEYAYGKKALRNFFVERDRLQAGLSDATLVIETGIKGGSIHTIEFTLKYGRKLLCLDHPEYLSNELKVQGNKHYLKMRKAIPIGTKESLEAVIHQLKGNLETSSVKLNELNTSEQHQLNLLD